MGGTSSLEVLEVLGRDETGARRDGELHLRDLSINILHELHKEVDDLVLEHVLSVEVGHKEGNVVALKVRMFEQRVKVRTTRRRGGLRE